MGRLLQVSHYAWLQSKDISNVEHQGIIFRLKIYFDMLWCFLKYRMWTNQYMQEDFHHKSKLERQEIGNKYIAIGKKRDAWQKDFRENRNFLIKYTNIKYEKSSLRAKRNKAYTERFHAGKDLFVEYDVNISRQHYLEGSIKIGNDILLSKHVYIDYSGEVVLSDNVKLSADVVIESHRHEFVPGAHEYKAVPTSIFIENGVWIGQRAVICEDCKKIGRYAQIGAGTVVRNPIPPYAIVVGNPAKIVGFMFTPDEVRDFESTHFADCPTDMVKYEADYKKYFIDRISEIKRKLKN